jgi:hypothetical protein
VHRAAERGGVCRRRRGGTIQGEPAKGGTMPGIFVIGFVGKAIAFIIVVFILAVIGLFALLKKAV